MTTVTPDVPLRKTPLFDAHKQAGAKLVAFGGWHMPVQYSGVLDEHQTVRNAVGLFDVSHMGELLLTGRGAPDFLQMMTVNDVTQLAVGQAQYSAFCYDNGTIVDDIVIYRLGQDSYFICVNAGNTEKDFLWLQQHLPTQGVKLENVSEAYVQIAVQGPQSLSLLQKLVDIQISSLKYYHFSEGKVVGSPAIIARTGYTGERGYEIYVAASAGAKIWNALLESGQALGVKPCGLGARDTLRLEMGYLLYGNDMNETTTVLECGLGWITKLKKPSGFVGKEALIAQQRTGLVRRLAAFKMVDKAIARHGYSLSLFDNAPLEESQSIFVTSGTVAPSLQQNIGLCYFPAEHYRLGQTFWVDVRGQRKQAIICQKPFYDKGTAMG